MAQQMGAGYIVGGRGCNPWRNNYEAVLRSGDADDGDDGDGDGDSDPDTDADHGDGMEGSHAITAQGREGGGLDQDYPVRVISGMFGLNCYYSEL
eukprot:3088896-Pyramimonas_sp.AAC.1